MPGQTAFTRILDYRATSGAEYLEPESAKAFEEGVKYGSGALSFEGAAFYCDYNNLQKVIIRRVRRSSGVRPSPRQGCRGIDQLQDRRAGDIGQVQGLSEDRCFTQIFIPDNGGDDRSEVAGFAPDKAPASRMAVQHVPKLSGTVSARYTLDLAVGELVSGANLYYKARIYFDAVNHSCQGAYNIASARLEWTDPSERVTLAVFGDNLFDEKYLTQLQVGRTGVGSIWDEPVTCGVSVRDRFGDQ